MQPIMCLFWMQPAASFLSPTEASVDSILFRLTPRVISMAVMRQGARTNSAGISGSLLYYWHLPRLTAFILPSDSLFSFMLPVPDFKAVRLHVSFRIQSCVTVLVPEFKIAKLYQFQNMSVHTNSRIQNRGTIHTWFDPKLVIKPFYWPI